MAKDYSGQVFGNLTAIQPTDKRIHKSVVWIFQCTCGKRVERNIKLVRDRARVTTIPTTPNCGCVPNKRKTTHNLYSHALYQVWETMVQRCYNSKHISYKYYGAKGVTICNLWRNSPSAFIHWALANGWQKGMQIDKDAKGLNMYSPASCSILTPRENCKLRGI